MTKSKLLVGLSIMAGLAVAATAVQAQQDSIAKRKEFMKSVGAAAKASNEMIKGDRPFDAKVAAENLTKVSAGVADFTKSFPKGSETGGETTAAPKIWEDTKDFEARAGELGTAAGKAAAEAAKGPDAFKAAWGDVGKTCKACHDIYRVPKK
jgi:cytochrome c556